MKTYNELITEATLLSNPVTNMAKFSALKGAYKAIENLARDVVYGGAKFIVKNPNVALAAAVAVDSVFGFAGTKALGRYFQERFPGHAMSVYNTLVKITVDSQVNPKDVGDALEDQVKTMRV